MINYETQLQHLSAARSSIQEAINDSVNDIYKGKLYAAQDVLTAHIDTLLSLETAQSNKDADQWGFITNQPK